MMINERELKTYYRQIRSQLICSNKRKKAFINSFSDDVKEYLKDHPDADINEIQDKMGTPKEIADEFIASESTDIIKSKVRIAKYFKIFLAVIIIMVLIVLILELINANNSFNGHIEQTIIQ